MPYNSKPKGKLNYVKPSTAPNGSAWPTYASYVSNYPKLNINGLSSVTVDNTKNDSEVFVKLVSIKSNESHPVRVFTYQNLENSRLIMSMLGFTIFVIGILLLVAWLDQSLLH